MRLDAAQRHLFLCVGPDCCNEKNGLRVWKKLKDAISRSGLPVLRTKAGCFKICAQGPLLLVYPEGIWYGELTVERCERIVEEHLLGGKPVVEWILREHPLGESAQPCGGALDEHPACSPGCFPHSPE